MVYRRREEEKAPSTLALLRRLLREPPEPIAADAVGDWWSGVAERCRALAEPIDQAIVAGFSADRLGFAFAGGYQAALRALVPALPDGAIASFCATEPGGNRPSAIETRLSPRTGGGFTLSGTKRWSTMAPLARVLLVVASEGADETGRKRLRVVAVDAGAPGVAIVTMPSPSFVPEVPHAEIDLHEVHVAGDAVLAGDGYARYVKPFRTVEDLHVHGATLGYLLSVARRHRFAEEARERIAASVVATRVLAALDPSAPELHIALAGVLAADATMLGALDAAWAGVERDERERWSRDRALFGSVAAPAREARRRRAWESLNAG